MTKKWAKICICLVLIIMLSSCQESVKLQINLSDISVETAVKKLNGVLTTCIVTPENDKSGSLNKVAYITGAVYFRLSQVDDNLNKRIYHKKLSDDACDAMVPGGGKIEIFENEESANRRNEQLAAYDSQIDVGYHSVRETVVIRFSRELTVVQQQELEVQLYNLFLETIHK